MSQLLRQRLTKQYEEEETPKRVSVETWYSWVVLVVGIVIHVVYFGLTWCVGVYYLIFLEAFRSGSGATSWIGSINTASMYYIAPIGGVLIARFTCRSLIMVGTVLSSIGLFLSFYASSIQFLYLTFGVFAGGGIGLAFIPIITLTSRYFDKHRAIAMGLCTGGIGITLFLFPMVIGEIKRYFGWRGSLIIFSGLMFQMVALAALLRPIHIPEDDVIKEKIDDEERTTIVQKLQLDVFKNKAYLILCMSDMLVLFGWSVVLVHLAAYGQTRGANTAWVFTALGVGQLLGRLFFGALGQWPRNDYVLVFCIAIFLAGLSIVILPCVEAWQAVLAVTLVHAFFQGVCGPYLPQLCIEFQGLSKLAPSYGYILLFEGTGVLLGAPAAGTLYDATSVYGYSFYLGGGSLILASLVMLPAWIWFSPKPRSLAQVKRANVFQSCDVIAGSFSKLAASRLEIQTASYERLPKVATTPDAEIGMNNNPVER